MDGGGGDFSVLRFSSDDLPERDRIAIWREVVGRQAARLEFEPTPGHLFCNRVSLRSLPGLVVMDGFVSASRASRTSELLSDSNSALLLNLEGTGRKMFSQLGREVELTGDTTALLSYAELGSVMQTSGRYFALQLPLADLAALVPRIEDMILRPVRRDSEAMRLLERYVGVLDEEGALATPELRRAVVAHVHDLVALAIGASRDVAMRAEERGGRAARLRAIKLDIAENLDRGDLTLGDIAQRHRLQPRYIQRLFELEGITFSEFLVGQRLARAHRMLTDPRRRDLGIAAIAFACGFNDQSYFNRRFRKRYGASPSDIRAAARRPED